MPKPRSETTKYRQRGFVCLACGEKLLIMGEEAPPLHCDVCGNAEAPVIEWDHDVTTKTIVVEHVAAPVAEA